MSTEMAIPNACDWWLLGSEESVLAKPILTHTADPCDLFLSCVPILLPP